MSSSSRIHAWIAIIATAALAGCSSTVSIDGTEQGDDLTDPADPADPNGDPPSIIDPVGSPPNLLLKNNEEEVKRKIDAFSLMI